MTNKLVNSTNSITLERRSLKLRLYPNEDQLIMINKTLGCTRFLYNQRVEAHNNFYENTIKPETDKDKQKELWKTKKLFTEKELKNKYEFLSEVSAVALQQATRDADNAQMNYIKSLIGQRKGATMGKPCFKSRRDNQKSFRIAGAKQNMLSFGNRTLSIPKIGDVKYRHNRIETWYKTATIKSYTITKDAVGDVYASVLFEKEIVREPKIISWDGSKIVGLDFSPTNLYVDSYSNSCKNDFGYIPIKQSLWKELRKLQKKLDKTKAGSQNHEKARIKVAKFERKIARKRLDFIEKETLRLVSNYEIIAIEDLNLKGISGYLHNAKNMNDTSWGTFVQKLEWKAKNRNCQIVKVGKFFPSSKLCNKCGLQNDSLRLSDRKWVCPNCGSEHNRDHNAAINIKNEGYKILAGSQEFRSVEDQQLSKVFISALNGSSETEKKDCEVFQCISTSLSV